MIRLIHCVHRRPEISIEEFRHFWHSPEFDALTGRMAKLAGANKVVKNLTLVVEINQRLMKERGSKEPFDAVMEVWWDNAKSLMQVMESPEMQQLMQELEAMQKQYIDFSTSRRFFTEWN